MLFDLFDKYLNTLVYLIHVVFAFFYEPLADMSFATNLAAYSEAY